MTGRTTGEARVHGGQAQDDGSVWRRPQEGAAPLGWEAVPPRVDATPGYGPSSPVPGPSLPRPSLPGTGSAAAWAEPTRPRRRRTRLAISGAVVAALALGALGGAVGGARAADDQDRVDALTGDVARLQDEVAGLQDEVADTRAQAADDVAAAREEAETAVAAENAATVSELDARAADLAAREAAVAQREDAVTVLEQQAADGSIPGDGIFLVGEEVAPGTYRAQDPGEFCYWERLSGLSGSFGDLITNGLGPADAAVTIQAGDVAFSTEDCGTWARIG